MTDNKKMTIEDALEIAMQWLEYGQYQKGSDNAKQAAAVLRQIGEPVERSDVVNRITCPMCDCHHEQCSDKISHYRKWVLVVTEVRWTETPVLKRVIEKSEPVYLPVESEE